MWAIPLLALDEGPASADPAPGEGGTRSEERPVHGTLAAVPTLYGYELTAEDGDRLVAALTDAGTHASLEAAAAIRWGEAMEVPVDNLDPSSAGPSSTSSTAPPPTSNRCGRGSPTRCTRHGGARA